MLHPMNISTLTQKPRTQNSFDGVESSRLPTHSRALFPERSLTDGYGDDYKCKKEVVNCKPPLSPPAIPPANLMASTPPLSAKCNPAMRDAEKGAIAAAAPGRH